MLFIGNDQCKVLIDHFFLDQRVCPDDHRIRKQLNALIGISFLLWHKGTCHQNHRYVKPELPAVFQKRLIVLSRKHFRRCHDRRLQSVVRHLRHCKECHDRLSRSDISLNQTLHHIVSVYIRADLLQCMLLRPCQRIRKLADQLFHEIILDQCKRIFLFLRNFFLLTHI